MKFPQYEAKGIQPRSDTPFVCRQASSVECRMAGKAIYARQDRGHGGA
jgi:hypothetical protein